MVGELIFDRARRTPAKTAVIYSGRPWSYRSLAQQIALARAYFSRRGYAGPGYAVLAFDNLLDFWIFGLALRSLGLTTAAVGSATMLTALSLPNVRCVITGAAEPSPDMALTCASRGWPLLSVSLEDETRPGRGVLERSYDAGGHILLTSGTTGIYKMVLMSPGVDAFFMRRKVDVFHLTEDSVVNLFDFRPWTGIGYRCAIATWKVGGTVIIEQRPDGYRTLREPGLSHLFTNPMLLGQLLAAPDGAFARSETLQLHVGGGTMTRRQIEHAKARITPRLFNSLASTEASLIGSTPQNSPEDQRWHSIVQDRAVEIVDDSDRPVEAGQIGRVRVATSGGPSGYLHNDAATATFFKNGYFYPGDLAIMRSDGRIALQGRSTDVINLNGHKVFPSPIEDRLRDLLDVNGVCLLSMQNGSGEEELHVAIETSAPLDNARLHAALKSALEDYPKPHIRVRYVRALPRNHMGKVERQTVRARLTASLAPA